MDRQVMRGTRLQGGGYSDMSDSKGPRQKQERHN